MRHNRRRRSRAPLIATGAAAVVLVAAGSAFAMMRGGDDDSPSVPVATPDPSSFGPAPSLDGSVVAIYPEHGATVKQEETRTGTEEFPGALCARVDLAASNKNGTWYRVAVDATEVTTELIWVGIDPASRELPEQAMFCFDPPSGLRAGRIDASIVVQEPNGISPPLEIVEWRFQVDP